MSVGSDNDWPPAFYFNGHLMPKWSAFWHWCSLGNFTGEFQEDWGEFISPRHLWQIQCRLDHVGVVESEDAHCFRICAQEVLLKLISHQDDVLRSIGNRSQGEPVEEVYHDLTEGLSRMIHLSGAGNVVFWTSGGQEGLAKLKDVMRRCGLAAPDPECMEPPHLLRRRAEAEARMVFQLSGLRQMAQAGVLDKCLRKLVNELPPARLRTPEGR